MPDNTAKYSGLGAAASPAKRNQPVVRDILIAFAISALPLVTFSGLLLGLVFWYRLAPHGHEDPRLPDGSLFLGKGIIYINLSATVFTTVSSWSSTVAPLSLPFILAIASYPAARRMIQASNGDKGYKLPTPYQIALVLRIMSNSSLSSVWQCIVYMAAGRRRAPISSVLDVITCTLVLGTIQSMFIFATDTWLHITTETVPFTQFHPITLSIGSFGLPPACTKMSTNFSEECPFHIGPKGFDYENKIILNALANTSETAVVKAHNVDGHQYAYVTAPYKADIDYTATTFAGKTNCTSLTYRCNIIGVDYKCDVPMEGIVRFDGPSFLETTYFTDSTLSSNETDFDDFIMPNPYYFGSIVGMRNAVHLSADHHLYTYSSIFLLCESTVFDVQYVSTNGSITRFSTSPSNSSTTNAIVQRLKGEPIGDTFILQEITKDFWDTSRSLDVVDGFGYAYSAATLAMSNGMIEPRPAEVAQLRSSTLVAAVPVAPLACLLVANVLVVLLATVLTVGALIEVAACSEVGDVQARLSIDSLVAAHFEPSRNTSAVKKTQDMFQEYQDGDGPRVKAQETTEDGWKLVSCDP